MMDSFGKGRFYEFIPEKYERQLKLQQEKAEFPKTVHLKFEPGFLGDLTA